jgi:tetratricopeptide (TPR) repeat protein
MGRNVLAGLVSALALIAPTGVLAAPVKREAPVSGRIVAKKVGETMVLTRTTDSRAAEVSQDVKAGDVLRTNASGTLALVFADRTQVRLARNTVLRVNAVQRGAPSSMTLQSGQVWGRTPRGGGSNLSVETPAATAGIRGTEWAITVEGDVTSLQVYTGEVELSNPQGSLSVTGGQAARAVVGNAPTRVALVNPVGREQMVYFVALEDGLDLFSRDDVPGMAEARRGDWSAARAAFAAVPPGSRARGVADFGEYVAAVQLGEDRPVPEVRADDPLSYVRRAYVLSFIGDLEGAIVTADQGVALDPGEAALYEIKARAALLLGDETRARGAVDAALARNPDDAAALALRSELALHYAGDPYAATVDAQRAVALDPARAGSYQALSDVRLERGGEREAMAAIDAAIARTPQSAALHARRAQILLAQKRMGAAKRAVDRALELDPSLSIVRTALADYHLLRGNKDEAREEALAASADNPGYSRALLELAEIDYRLGDHKAAIQQLDAADRLDPNSPLTPLARAAIALHRYEAGTAIESANEALKRFQARGGVYSNLSENRETGSIVSQSFRFLQLEGWGRYYGDRVFDSFTPSSYFDQALNQTPGPFFVRNEDGNFNADNGEDFDQLSSFLQGVALDPLSVADSRRLLQFDNGSFFEAEAGGDYLTEDLRERKTATGKVNGITLSPMPIAFGIEGTYSDYRDDRLRPDLGVAPGLGIISRNDGGEEGSIEAYLGFEPTAYDQVALAATYSKDEDRALTDLNFGGPTLTIPREETNQKTSFGFGVWSHEFGYRNRATFAGGIGKIKLTKLDSLSFDDLAIIDAEIPARVQSTELDFKYFSANYAKSFGMLDARAGVEYADYSIATDTFVFDIANPDTPGLLFADTVVDYGELRGYLNLRYRANDFITLEGQVNVVNLEVGVTAGGSDLGDNNSTDVDWRIGVAAEPAPGHWFRMATLRETKTLFPFTFRPVNVLGLKGNTFPTDDVFRTRSHIVRWDAQWSRHFFTAIELQDQRHDGVSYTVPDSSIELSGGPVRLQRASVEANWWVGGNLGLRASYAYTDSSMRGVFNSGLSTRASSILSNSGCSTQVVAGISCRYFKGDQLPFVPKHTGRVSAVWTVPAPLRLKAEIGANLIGGQIDDLKVRRKDFVIADAKVQWEPFGRRFDLSIQALNLLDRKYSAASGVQAPRRTFIFTGKVRF